MSVHVIENAVADVGNLIVASAEEVPTVVTQQSRSRVVDPKTKKTPKCRKAQHAETESQDSVKMAEQGSIAAKRNLESESTSSASVGPDGGDNTASLKKGRFHPYAKISIL